MSEHAPYTAPEFPHLFDRWEDEVELEKGMLASGRERQAEKVRRATDKQDMTRLRPYRSLLASLVEPTAENLRAWIAGSQHRRGPRPLALPYLLQLDAEPAALIALRTVLRMLGIEKRMVLALAHEIGTWVEHEAQVQAWQEKEPASWESLKRGYVARGSNAAHMKRSRISVFNAYVAERIGWEDWGPEVRRRVGLQLINCIVQGTRRFHVAPDRSLRPGKGNGPKAFPWVLRADPELMQWLSDAMDDDMVHYPVYRPTVIPPKPWIGPKDGGYWTPYVKSPFLVRFKAQHESQRQRAIDEYEALDLGLTLDALNWLQEVPWRVNRRVLDVARQVWDRDLALAGLERQEAETPEPAPVDYGRDSDVWKAWASRTEDLHGRNAKRFSRFLSQRRTLVEAGRFAEEGAIWFPHMMDFRGRIYPIPSDLQPQGNDLHRGLLEFHHGERIGTTGGEAWLGVSLANAFGVDKVSFEERLAWVNERQGLWERISEDPLGNRQWADAEDPWQALAAIFELASYYRLGEDHVTHLPVRVDGTCNGIQHLAALARDEGSGRAVNLVPGPAPRDIYGDVAGALLPMLEAEPSYAYAQMWLRLFQGRAPRSITKRPVMILPYGGTPMAAMEYTRQWLEENDPEARVVPKDERSKAAGYLVSKMWKAVKGHVGRPMEIMEFIKACAAEVAETGRPIYWRVPVGFYVRQFYGQMEERRVDTDLDGQRINLVSQEPSRTLDVKAQASGIAPNFIHSLDASAMLSTAILARDCGIPAMTTIHDSYGCHATRVPELSELIREAFIQTHAARPLEEFRAACGDMLEGDESRLPDLPEDGALDLEAVRRSDYFFS